MADLDRFLKMHDKDYKKALSEIKSGKKKTCWIWYILPIMKGLRDSKNCKFYGIKSFEEATAYLSNDILRAHLIEMSNAILNLGKVNMRDVMGSIDDVKLQQCMTLFNKVEETMNIDCGKVFKKVLVQFYNDQEDKRTLEILENQKAKKQNKKEDKEKKENKEDK